MQKKKVNQNHVFVCLFIYIFIYFSSSAKGPSTVTKTDIKQHIQQHFYLFAGKQTTRVEALIERTCDMCLCFLSGRLHKKE